MHNSVLLNFERGDIAIPTAAKASTSFLSGHSVRAAESSFVRPSDAAAGGVSGDLAGATHVLLGMANFDKPGVYSIGIDGEVDWSQLTATNASRSILSMLQYVPRLLPRGWLLLTIRLSRPSLHQLPSHQTSLSSSTPICSLSWLLALAPSPLSATPHPRRYDCC